MSARPMSLAAYRLATQAFEPLAGAFLRWRLMRGKEEAARLREKLGQPGAARPEGALAWLHGASVGEGLALLPLAERLVARGLEVLITTGTASSARVLAERLPPGARHQFAPLDTPRFVGRFLDHWRPSLALFAESELWPNMIAEAGRRRLPLMLVNARLSPRSFARWRKWQPQLIASTLGHFDLCLAQSRADAERLGELGARRILVSGNLKYDVSPPPVDSVRLAALQAEIGARPVWLAASTHPGEEMLATQAHRRLLGAFPNLLTIIAPRHASRGDEIAAGLAGFGDGLRRRSRGQPADAGAQIYLADTMGEMGLLFRLAPVVFVGKSLAVTANPNLGGQNPIEPAKLGSAILHGPHVGNFAEVYESLDLALGAQEVADVDDLAQALGRLLGDSGSLRQMARQAHDAVSEIGGASERVMRALEPYLAQTLFVSR